MLGHRRLAILDLSNAAAQPMCDPVFRHAIVLNGEIYNYVELRERLQAAGHRFESSGDTAVMLRALCESGSEAIGKLRGMFAFAFWNTAERSLYLARDPLGIKPLYVARPRSADAGWSLAFASEVRALLASGLIERPVLDANAVGSIVWQGFAIAPNTAVEQIESLMPGEWRSFDDHGKEISRLDYATAATSREQSRLRETDIEAALEESVRLHLASDVPLGIFLSGGIDSSAIANLAQRTAGTRVKTFTLAFGEPEYNEGKIARQVAEAIGTEHQEVLLTEQRFVSELDAALDSLDQPTFDGLNSYYMSHAVREGGFTVALAGSGGDELFGGYLSFRKLPSVMRWSALTRWAPASA
ncbi:MAG: asparagine synthase (glutamine-hydrolyzing), partial [Stellaceae bacterium]